MITPVMTSTDGPLGRDDKMHSGSPSHLRQSADGVFDFTWSCHHQVSQLIDDNNDLWHWLKAVFFGSPVKACHITHAVILKHLVAVEHLIYCPGERACGLFGVGDNWNQQVWDAVINAELDHFRVDEQKLYFLRGGVIKNADDQGVDADRFTGPGGTGNQEYAASLPDRQPSILPAISRPKATAKGLFAC